MRILVLFAHPVETSFAAALHAKVVETLKRRGHDVDDCDLNAEGFDPVMSRQDRIEYYDVAVNRRRVKPYVDRLLAAEALAFSFPVWNMGFPAILKGFVDKVFLPGVAFQLTDEGAFVPTLHNIRRLGVVCTYGGGRLKTLLMGDPSRRFLTRTLRPICAPGARCDYLACYDMDHTTPERRKRFLTRVEAKFSTW
ncbi:MAG: NAD(P)H-dependent oxidoreductase [Hyphomicrobiales bacterium]|nr:NAD(P)H-dependent oxidoreductase [Hyphomicrobiales bacterium]